MTSSTDSDSPHAHQSCPRHKGRQPERDITQHHTQNTSRHHDITTTHTQNTEHPPQLASHPSTHTPRHPLPTRPSTAPTMSSPASSSSFSALSSPMDSPTAASHPPHTPNKRHPSAGFSDHSPLLAHHHSPSHLTHLSDISSDTSGSVPGSPSDDDFDHAEQVTVCRWDGCDCDLGDMDALVKHIHDLHIGSRRAKYACEWDDCTRKGMAHASGYALRAHMRSHTKEKPFYCTLPGKSPPPGSYLLAAY